MEGDYYACNKTEGRVAETLEKRGVGDLETWV
jgi:hypothetical protein